MSQRDAEEAILSDTFHPLYNPFRAKPLLVKESNPYNQNIFTRWPIFGPLLFENSTSEVRDNAANERTFLSTLRLSIYMATVSVAVVSSFHLKHEPSDVERQIALPVGIIFWLLALSCLIAGTANYAATVTRFSRSHALVQRGWKSHLVFTIVAIAIVGACILFLSIGPK